MQYEKKIQKAILDYLQLYVNRGDAYTIRTASGSIKTEKGRYFKTGKPGCPDITVCYKGLFIGFEVKTQNGIQSKNQKLAQSEIEKAKGYYFVVRSIDDVKNSLETVNETITQ